MSFYIVKRSVIRLFHTVIDPRPSETDANGHINNTVLPIWLEAGRKEIFKIFTPDLSFKNWKLVIVKTTLEYTHQIFYGQDVEIKTWVKRIGHTSFELYEEVYQNDHVCARNEAVYVNFNFSTQKPEPIPEEIKEKLESHLYQGE